MNNGKLNWNELDIWAKGKYLVYIVLSLILFIGIIKLYIETPLYQILYGDDDFQVKKTLFVTAGLFFILLSSLLFVIYAYSIKLIFTAENFHTNMIKTLSFITHFFLLFYILFYFSLYQDKDDEISNRGYDSLLKAVKEYPEVKQAFLELRKGQPISYSELDNIMNIYYKCDAKRLKQLKEIKEFKNSKSKRELINISNM